MFIGRCFAGLCVYSTTCLAGALGGQNRTSDLLEPRLQVVVRTTMWVLRIEPKSSALSLVVGYHRWSLRSAFLPEPQAGTNLSGPHPRPLPRWITNLRLGPPLSRSLFRPHPITEDQSEAAFSSIPPSPPPHPVQSGFSQARASRVAAADAIEARRGKVTRALPTWRRQLCGAAGAAVRG